jgi:hypothetical protein
MNERIKELAFEANKDLDGNVPIGFAEKFAELIVRECIDILPEKVRIDDLYDGRILVQCGMAIKEHFGVE